MPPPDPSKAALTRKQQFFAIVAVVLVLASALNHLLVRVLAIRTDAIDRGKIAAASGDPVLVMGSSLTFSGIWSISTTMETASRPASWRSK